MQNEKSLFTPKRFLVFFLIFNTVIATLIPTLLYRVLPLDTVEAVIWGQCFTLGNYKHPPLSGWIANAFSALFGHADFAMYFLSQLCVAISYYFIYKIAREFFSERKSVLASLLLAITFFYSFDSAKFNVNILHLALWPMTTFAFIKAVKIDRWYHWIGLAILAALCIWCKLFGGLLLLMLALLMLLWREARSRFAGVGPYLTAVVTLLLFAPYVIWLYRTDFLPLTYIADRVHEEKNAFYFPLEILLYFLVPLLAPLAALLVAGGKEAFSRFFSKKWHVDNRPAFRFAGFLLFFPIVFFTVLSFFVPKIDPMWGYPIYFTLGIFFLSFYEEEFWTELRFKRLAVIIVAVVLAFQVGDVIYFFAKTRQSGHFPAHEFAQAAGKFYVEKTGKTMPSVCGTMWFACLISHYQESRPLVCIQEDPLDVMRYRRKIESEGAMYIFHKKWELDQMRQLMDVEITDITQVHFPYKAHWGKIQDPGLFFAILRPRTPCAAEKK